MGLLDDLTQYVADALPGGLLNPEWTPDRVQQAGGLLTDFTPIVGGATGAVENAQDGNYGLAALNAATVPLDVVSLGGGSLLKAGLLGMAIDPAGKSRLIADLIAGMGSGSYKLGDVTQGQLNKLTQLFGRTPAGPDVMMSDKALGHLIDTRMTLDRFTPQEVGKFAEQALMPRAVVDLDVAKRFQNPALVSGGLLDPVTRQRYDARMPLDLLEDGSLGVRSVVPDGLRGRKK